MIEKATGAIVLQPDLFGMETVRRVATITDGVRVGATANENGLRQLAFLYTASEKHNNSGIRFALSVEEAMVWCESEISRGVLHGTQWAYFWTSAWNYLMRYNSDGMVIDITGLEDNGQWDARIASLGLRKISLTEFPAVLGALGVEVKNDTKPERDEDNEERAPKSRRAA